MKLVKNIFFISGEIIIVIYLVLWCYNWFNPSYSTLDDTDFYIDTWPPQ